MFLLWRLQYWYPLYSHVKSFCVNQKWKSSWRTSFSTNLQRSCWHCNVLWINENYAVLVLFSKLIEIKPSFLSFPKGCSLHMQLQWRLPWFQPLPQILIKITIGRGIAGGSHAIASIFHNSQRRAAILFRQFTLVSLPFQKVTFSLFIFSCLIFLAAIFLILAKLFKATLHQLVTIIANTLSLTSSLFAVEIQVLLYIKAKTGKKSDFSIVPLLQLSDLTPRGKFFESWMQFINFKKGMYIVLFCFWWN